MVKSLHWILIKQGYKKCNMEENTSREKTYYKVYNGISVFITTYKGAIIDCWVNPIRIRLYDDLDRMEKAYKFLLLDKDEALAKRNGTYLVL